MAYRFDIVEGGKHAVDRVDKGVKDELHTDLMVCDVDFLVHPFLAGRFVGDVAAGKADLFNDALGHEVVHIVALHVQQLILYGRTSAIDYKDYHIFFFWFFRYRSAKLKKYQ